MMRGWLLALAAALPWLAWPVAPAPGQTLPSAVDPGIQEQRLLPSRSPRLGTVVLRDLDCESDAEAAATRFILRGVIIESEMRLGAGDPAAHWQPYLGEEISLAELCAIARAVAEDEARRSGRAARAVVPAQRIAEGMVHIRIVEAGAVVPGPD